MMWPAFLRRRRPTRPCILMYHRVTELAHDPWGLAVTPENFEAQIALLARRFKPIPLDDFVQRCSAGDLTPDHVAITFDDAYPDNLVHARPILIAHAVPATVFVVAGGIDAPDPFWWDELAALCLQSTRECDLVLTVGQAEIRMQWSSNHPATPGWRATEPPPGPREQAFLALYTPLQRSDAPTRARAIEQLRSMLGPVVLADSRSMNSQELACHLDGDCIRPGGHSSTHPALSHLAPDDARREIEGSAADLKQRFGERQYGFAYPYGDMNAAVMRMVREAGFAYACSTRHGGVGVERADLFALPRIAVGNWSPSVLLRIMSDA